MQNYDLVVKGGNLVIPRAGIVKADLAASGGKIAEIAEDIPTQKGDNVVDASGRLVFPGVVDPHFHIGLFRPLRENATSESRSAASGGITTLVSYYRTGINYLNKTGPYREIFPEVLELSRDSFIVDYAYSLTILTEEQRNEIEWLVSDAGVSEFKYFITFKGTSAITMTDEPVDLGFLYEVMQKIATLNDKYKDYGTIRLSLHCEEPEIIRVCTRRVRESGGSGNFSKDYDDSRPGWSEGLAVYEAGIIAAHTGCPIYLVHLTSREAVDAVRNLSQLYPKLDMMRETTPQHLTLANENDYGIWGIVNPPIRSQADVDYLWEALLAGDIDVIGSDHGSLTREQRGKGATPSDVTPGFGPAPLMLPVMITEGYHKRGLALERIAELISLNPATINNLYPRKGTIAIGSDADLAIVDINAEKTVTAATLHSVQDFTPFEGITLRGWVDTTILRGEVIFTNGEIVGKPGYGEYIKRPIKLHQKA